MKGLVGSQQLSTSPEETQLKHPPLSAIERTMEIVNTPATEKREDPQETTYKTPVGNSNAILNHDLRQEGIMPGRPLSEERRNPSEPQTLRIQDQTLEELNSLGFHHQASAERHLLSIAPSLIADDLEEATTPLDKFKVTYKLDR